MNTDQTIEEPKTIDEKVVEKIEDFWKRHDEGEFGDDDEEEEEKGLCYNCGIIHELSLLEEDDDNLYCGFCFNELQNQKESFEEYYERNKDCRCNEWKCYACCYRKREEE